MFVKKQENNKKHQQKLTCGILLFAYKKWTIYEYPQSNYHYLFIVLEEGEREKCDQNVKK